MIKYYLLMIKHTLTLILLVFSSLNVQSQTNAVTEYGDQVILFDDGTWQYADEELNLSSEINENPNPFVKPENSNFLLKSNQFNVGIWLNSKLWKFSKAVDNEDAEYQIVLKGEDLYGTIISEKVPIPLESLREIALLNARDVAPDTKIDHEEYRNVNGLRVLMLEMSGTISGINFAYKGYYYSNSNGTIQIILYTSKSLIKQYDAQVEDFLNGFVEL